MQAPPIRLNAAPEKIYEVTISMREAPTSLQAFEATVEYMIGNYLQCVPVDHKKAIGGIRQKFRQTRTIQFLRSENDTFKTQLVDDLFLNENYYGLGSCRWKASGFASKLDMPSSELPRIVLSTDGIFRSGIVETMYCLQPEHVDSDLVGLCGSAYAMKAREVPQEKLYTVKIEARRER